MSDATKIDTLSIEITTNSNSAINNLEDLAIAMEDIKKQGKLSTAVKNLQGLATAIRKIAEAKSPTANLTAIKEGMEAIKQVGSITTTVNRVDKLVESMRGVSTVDLSGAKEKFNGIRDALSGLSEIKSGGFGSMINGLSKIDKVTKMLGEVDENGVDTIDRFAERIEKLTRKLTPLSEKMTTIQAGLKGIKLNSRSAGAAVGQFGGNLNKGLVNAAAFSKVLEVVNRVLGRVKEALTEAAATAIEWDGIAARFGRGFGSNARETYDWIKRLNSEININTQDFMQYSSVYATMLTGYGVAQEDAAKMALGYTELTYDIWAGYNDIYKSFEDAAVAVRAAIAGETEPIQKAGLDVRDSALKQIAALNGVEYSTQGATQAQKSYLRYLALVNQAQNQSLVGAYAAEMDKAEGVVRTLAQQIKSLGQTIGSVLLPILVEIIPWVQAFTELVNEAIISMAGFFGIEIQPINFSSSTGLEGITGSAMAAEDAAEGATEALKDLKKATIGIDELNVISPQTNTSTSTGGADWESLDVKSLWDEAIFESINARVDELKEKLKNLLPVVTALGTAFAALRFLDVIPDLSGVLNMLKDISWVKTITTTISNGLMKAFGGTSFGWIVSVVGAKIKTALAGIGTWLAGAGGVWTAVVATVVGLLALAIADYDFSIIGRKVGEAVGKACRAVTDWFSDIGDWVKDGLDKALKWASENINLDSIWQIFDPNWWGYNIIPLMVEVGMNIVDGIGEGIWNGFLNFLTNIGEFVQGCIDGFNEAFGIHSPAETMKPIGQFIVEGIWEGFKGFDIFDEIGKWAGEVWKTIKGWFGGSKKADEKITVGVELVKQDWSTVKAWIGNITPIDQPISLKKKDWKTVPKWVGTIPVMEVPMKLVKSGWSSVRSWLGDLNFRIGFSLPRIGVNWNTRYNRGFTITYPSSFYTYAKGGFPDFGEMFIARENGPEMVGKIGSKTTVANNEQIIEGISEGVYAAVVAAMRQSEASGGQNINVYLDGRKITSSVEKHQRERGANLIRNGVYAY